MDHNIEILYENEDVVVVNKPSGLIVHKDGKTDAYTLADWVAEQYPETSGVGEPLILNDGTHIDRPGIVHRLDRDTSGVLVIAKNQPAFEHLKQQFQEHHVRKTYVAIVYGVVKKDTDTIDRPIGRSASDFRKWLAVSADERRQRGARGKTREAVTQYEVMRRGSEYTALRVFPQTGRTHQIRVHLKAINHPVLCDALYAPKRPCALGMERQALHAEELSFTAPNGEHITVEAPLPDDMQQAVAAL